MCCYGNFIYKGKMNKRNNTILINAVPMGKDLLKIGVREPKVANIDDTLVYLTLTLSKYLPDGVNHVVNHMRYAR